MGYVCLLQMNCSDGDIQVVIGSQDCNILEKLEHKSKIIHTTGRLQSKVTELLEYLDISDDVVDKEVQEHETETVDIAENDNDDINSDINYVLHETNENSVVRLVNDIELEEIKMEEIDIEQVNIIDEFLEEENIDSLIVHTPDGTKGKFDKRQRKKQRNDEIRDLLKPEYDAPRQDAQFLEKIAAHKPFMCVVCKLPFGTATELRSHTTTSHDTKLCDNIYGCVYCDKSYNNLTSLTKHFGTHWKPYNCSHCDKSYSDVNNLKRHLLQVKKIFTEMCNICGLQFITAHELKSHMVTHSSELSFQCSICGKSFARQFQLNRHVTTHNESRDVSCDLCHKTFHNRVNYLRHRKTHESGRIRKYICPWSDCSKAYFNNYSRQQHVKAYHAVAANEIIEFETETDLNDTVPPLIIVTEDNIENVECVDVISMVE